MYVSEKEQEIIDLLSETSGTTSVKTISEKLFLSEPSIRRYLTSLANKKLIVRTHGGAIIDYYNPFFSNDVPLNLRLTSRSDEKSSIAKEASQLIFDGAKVFIDSSSTAFHIIPFLSKFNDVHVITNNLKTAIAATEMNIKTICLGGDIQQSNLSCNSFETISALSKFNADLLFFSCDSLSDEGTLTDKSKETSHIREQYLKYSKTKVLLIDNTKLHKKEWYTICNLKDIDYCFCNTPLPEELQKMFKK